MGNKDPSPHADALRAQREARYGHLQATAAPPKPRLIPYAGKPPGGREDLYGNKNPPPSAKPARKRRKLKRKIA